MRQLICALCLLLPTMPAHATIIDFLPGFVISNFFGPRNFTIENFSIVSRSTATSANGSGSALAIVNDWNSAEIRVALGDGPGQAQASLTNIATFDLVFDGPDEVGLDAGYGINGPIEIDPGDSGFANYSISIDVDGLVLEESNAISCIGDPASDIPPCFGFLDDSVGSFPFVPGPDRRLSVSTSMVFDIGVSRAAIAVAEPGALVMMLMSLVWLGRRRLVASRG